MARQRLVDYYFTGAGGLAPAAGAAGSDSWRVDPQADSRSAGANRWNYRISLARAPLDISESNRHRLTYTTDPLTSGIEVTGHPLVHLVLGSSAGNGDVFAYLEDVAPDGRALLVTEGQLRANYPRVHPMQQLLGSADTVPSVRPDLPWHGYGARDYLPDVFAGGRAVTLDFDLLPTSWVFRAGHRIRLSLAGADSPSFAPHPALIGEPPALWTIHRGAALSRITLPLIPPGD
ncbi:MAG: CocE/NonD family hydrolase [Gammaproteobacteria bacterium]|nr:CocE/NonD family hydrolase [Gammaproteobacteria bacterium]